MKTDKKSKGRPRKVPLTKWESEAWEIVKRVTGHHDGAKNLKRNAYDFKEKYKRPLKKVLEDIRDKEDLYSRLHYLNKLEKEIGHDEAWKTMGSPELVNRAKRRADALNELRAAFSEETFAQRLEEVLTDNTYRSRSMRAALFELAQSYFENPHRELPPIFEDELTNLYFIPVLIHLNCNEISLSRVHEILDQWKKIRTGKSTCSPFELSIPVDRPKFTGRSLRYSDTSNNKNHRKETDADRLSVVLTLLESAEESNKPSKEAVGYKRPLQVDGIKSPKMSSYKSIITSMIDNLEDAELKSALTKKVDVLAIALNTAIADAEPSCRQDALPKRSMQ